MVCFHVLDVFSWQAWQVTTIIRVLRKPKGRESKLTKNRRLFLNHV
jgi:hypothetical protein